MPSSRDDTRDLDEALVTRVGSMSGGSQRWLKTALQAILVSGDALDDLADVSESAPTAEPQERETPRAPDLEDVLSGKMSLEEQLERYPELSEELDGLTDIIDLLRDAGERRRSRGEQILREEILGEEPESDGKEDGEEPGPGQSADS
ncbi:MAG: hypothetical protein ACE5FA_08990 [Dehalococcoidia bacterium]